MAKNENRTAFCIKTIGLKRVHNITTIALLEEAIRDIWTEIAVEFLQNLYESIPKRRLLKLKET